MNIVHGCLALEMLGNRSWHQKPAMGNTLGGDFDFFHFSKAN